MTGLVTELRECIVLRVRQGQGDPCEVHVTWRGLVREEVQDLMGLDCIAK